MIQNERGFALAVVMATLPLVIAGFFLVWGGIGFIQQDLALKYACRQQGLIGQKKVAPLLEKLLSLNPKAAKLRRDFLQTQEALKDAVSVSNHPLAAALAARLIVIETQRTALDIQQRRLIQESNHLLSSAHRQGHQEILRHANGASNIFIKLSLQNISGRAPLLAVRPDLPDIAPTYSPVPDFSNQQSLAHHWQYIATIQEPMAQFLSGKFAFQKACAVTLKKEALQWIPQITKANFSLKSVW